MKKFRAEIVAAGLLMLVSSAANASVITPVSVTATSTYGTYNVNNLINNSGLSNGLHDIS